MMGYRLSEEGGEEVGWWGGGCFKCKSFSYKNRFRLKGFLGNEPHCHGRGDSEQEKNSTELVRHQGERRRGKSSKRKGYMSVKEGIETQVRPPR